MDNIYRYYFQNEALSETTFRYKYDLEKPINKNQ